MFQTPLGLSAFLSEWRPGLRWALDTQASGVSLLPVCHTGGSCLALFRGPLSCPSSSCPVPEVLSFLLLSSPGGLVLPFFLLSCPVPEVLSCPSSSCLVQFRTSCLASPCLVLCCSVAAASCGDEDRVLSAVELTGCWELTGDWVRLAWMRAGRRH